jgi:cytochrome c peroxidase
VLRSLLGSLLVSVSLLALGCPKQEQPAPPAASAPVAAPTPAEAGVADVAALRTLAGQVLGTLPTEAASESNPLTPEKIDLGRMLYLDKRFSKNHDLACASCHMLDKFGADGEPTSPGHKGQRGDRNSPSSFNAALHFAQFWDGRAADVEEQAKGPVLNPVEMAMPSEEDVVAVLKSIPGYAPLFAAAFPGDADPIHYDNMARAIGAFERRLLTPGPLDAFLAGDDAALSPAAQRGLAAFLEVGCTTCHFGASVGGQMYQKLGLVEAYPTQDVGRAKVTGNEADNFFFKVPSLRNVAETGPYFHDGSVATLDEAVTLMAKHQLGKTLDDATKRDLLAFLGALTGSVDAAYVAAPVLPESGPTTPAPDPS